MSFGLSFDIQTKNLHRPIIRVSSIAPEFKKQEQNIIKPTTKL
jgi:hypothetical protein